MTTADKAVLVTGANRGIGRALVEEALRRGASRVYAATRRPLTHQDARVTPLILDVTDAAQIQRAVERVESLDILVNNAGIAALRRPERSRGARTAPRRQSLRHVRRDPGVPAPADALTGRHRQQRVDDGVRPAAAHAGVRGLEGGRVQPDAVAACPAWQVGVCGCTPS